jgi:GT2 family glycosyltransferase
MDVLVPSHNRAALLERAVRSVLRAESVPGFTVRVTVICNGCTDGSVQRMAALKAEAPDRVFIVSERRSGKSRALNLGIASTSAPLVGMIDDDEEVDAGWVRVVAAAFADDRVDFIGGPYVACWDTPPPSWVPSEYLAVLGVADCGTMRRHYTPSFPGMLKGGNAVVRRRLLRAVGPYAEYLGPCESSRLFSCEDEEMYLRFLEHGARGRYLPELVIYHHVLSARLTPSYYRQWCFWRGVSRGLMDHTHRLKVSYLAGVPRFLYGRAWRSLVRLALGIVRPVPVGTRLGDELPLWDLAGYFCGRHMYRLIGLFGGKRRRAEDRGPMPPRLATDNIAGGAQSPADAYNEPAAVA